MDGEEDPNNLFIYFLNSSRIDEGYFRFLLLQLYFICKIINIFLDASMNYGYVIFNEIIANMYK